MTSAHHDADLEITQRGFIFFTYSFYSYTDPFYNCIKALWGLYYQPIITLLKCLTVHCLSLSVLQKEKVLCRPQRVFLGVSLCGSPTHFAACLSKWEFCKVTNSIQFQYRFFFYCSDLVLSKQDFNENPSMLMSCIWDHFTQLHCVICILGCFVYQWQMKSCRTFFWLGWTERNQHLKFKDYKMRKKIRREEK